MKRSIQVRKLSRLIFGSSLVCSLAPSAAFSAPRTIKSRHGSSTVATAMSSSPDANNNTQQSTADSFSLSGKTVLVTGSSGGIGKAIAKTFAEAGADVIVHYNSRREGAISTFKEINEQQESGKCLGIIQADFRNPKEVDEMFQFVTNDILKDSRLDILVNNAGIVTKLAVEDDDNLSTWHETMAVNLHAPLQLMKLSHSHMKATSKKRKGGVIINNTSIHGSRSVEYMTAYAASKAALDSLTRGLACEYASDGVRVNAIAPGVVPVERTADALSNQDVVDLWTPHLPVGRFGSVEEIAQATLVLATNEWMTGTVLTVDGGMMARANMPIRPRPPKPEPVVEDDVDESEETSGVLFEVPE